jgi:hypothetical protein
VTRTIAVVFLYYPVMGEFLPGIAFVDMENAKRYVEKQANPERLMIRQMLHSAFAAEMARLDMKAAGFFVKWQEFHAKETTE